MEDGAEKSAQEEPQTGIPIRVQIPGACNFQLKKFKTFLRGEVGVERIEKDQNA